MIGEDNKMLSFECDYLEGAHEAILDRLLKTNTEQLSGYGVDKYSISAKEKIKSACGCPDADVFLLVGGTQTNAVVISSVLRSYEGVVCVDSGHINSHESGAIEYTGHKVLSLSGRDGKLDADTLDKYLHGFFDDANHEHMVFPGMVYVSHPTEYGTLYSKSELTSISEVCRRYGLPLYLDGARLGYGLMSDGTDVTLHDVARLCDVFYIGATKVGALCGEAVVFPRGNAPAHFFTSIKQHGALLAKGRLLGIQFDTLFSDGLYEKISRHAIEMANLMRDIFREKGYRFHIETVTNQIFIVLTNDEMEKLRRSVLFDFWERVDENHTVVRFASSWATTEENVNELASLL